MASLFNPSSLNSHSQLPPAQAALKPPSTPAPPISVPVLDDANMFRFSSSSSRSNLEASHQFGTTETQNKSPPAETQMDGSLRPSSIAISEPHHTEGTQRLSSSSSQNLESSWFFLHCLGNAKVHDGKRAMNRTGSCIIPDNERLDYSFAQQLPSSVDLVSSSRTWHGLKETYSKSTSLSSPTCISGEDVQTHPEPDVMKSKSLGSKDSKRNSAEPASTVEATIPPSLSTSNAVASYIALPMPFSSGPSNSAECAAVLDCNVPIHDPDLEDSQDSSQSLAFPPTANMQTSNAPSPTSVQTPNSLSLSPSEASNPIAQSLPTVSSMATSSLPSSINGTALSRKPAEMISDCEIGESSRSLPVSPMPVVQPIPLESRKRDPSPPLLPLERPHPVPLTSVLPPSLSRPNSSTGFSLSSSSATHHSSASVSSLYQRPPTFTPHIQQSLQTYSYHTYNTSTSSLNVATIRTTSPDIHDSSPTQTLRNMTMKRLLARPAPPSPCPTPPAGYAGYTNGFGGVIGGVRDSSLRCPEQDGNVGLKKERDIGFSVIPVKQRKKRSRSDGIGSLTMPSGREVNSSLTPFSSPERQNGVHDHLPKGEVNGRQFHLWTGTSMMTEQEQSSSAMAAFKAKMVENQEDKPTKRQPNVLRRKSSSNRSSRPQATTLLAASLSHRDCMADADANCVRRADSSLSHAIDSAARDVCIPDPTEGVRADMAGGPPRHFKIPRLLGRSRSSSSKNGNSRSNVNATLKGSKGGRGDGGGLTPAASLIQEYKAKEKEKSQERRIVNEAVVFPEGNYPSAKPKLADRRLRRSASLGFILSSGVGSEYGLPLITMLATGELPGVPVQPGSGHIVNGVDMKDVHVPSRDDADENRLSRSSSVTLRFSKTARKENVTVYASDDCGSNESLGVPTLGMPARKCLAHTALFTMRRGVQSDHGHGGDHVHENNPRKGKERDRHMSSPRVDRGRERKRRTLRLSIDKFPDDIDQEKLRKGAEQVASKSNGGNKLWRLMRKFSISLPRERRAKSPPPLVPNLPPSNPFSNPLRSTTNFFSSSSSSKPIPVPSSSTPPTSPYMTPNYTPSLQALQYTRPVPRHPAASALSLHIVNPSTLETACRVEDTYDSNKFPERSKFYNLYPPLDLPSPKSPREGDWVRSHSPDLQLSSLPLPPRRAPKLSNNTDPDIFSVTSGHPAYEIHTPRPESPLIPSFSTDDAINTTIPSSPSRVNETSKSISRSFVMPSFSFPGPSRTVTNPPGPKPKATRDVYPSIPVGSYAASQTRTPSIPSSSKTQLTPTYRSPPFSAGDADVQPLSSSSNVQVNDLSQLNTFHRSNFMVVPSVVTRPGTANTFGAPGGYGTTIRPGTGGSTFSVRSGASSMTERGIPIRSTLNRTPSYASSIFDYKDTR